VVNKHYQNIQLYVIPSSYIYLYVKSVTEGFIFWATVFKEEHGFLGTKTSFIAVAYNNEYNEYLAIVNIVRIYVVKGCSSISITGN